MKKIGFLFLLLGVASTAFALEYNWDAGGGADNNWMNAANWNATGYPDTLPTMTGAAFGTAKLQPTINSNILINSNGPEAFQVKVSANVTGGATWNTLTVTGGSLNSGEWLMVGADAPTSRSGQLDMSGGTINLGLVTPANGNFFVAHTGSLTKGIVNMSGGTINVTGNFWIARVAGATGTVTMSGDATINTAAFQMGPGNALLDITGSAKLVVNGNVTGTIDGYIDGGKIKSDGVGLDALGIYSSYDAQTNKTTLMIPEPATVCMLSIGALSLIRRKK